MNVDREPALREHLHKLLDWDDAHVNFEAAVRDIPPGSRGVVPQGLRHSLWQLLEHLRRTQRDILEFCRSPAYVEPPAEEYWPPAEVPPTAGAWDESVAGFRGDLAALKELARDRAVDLCEHIPHGSGQTYLRELLLAADHNTYHVAQMVTVRRLLGIWRAS